MKKQTKKQTKALPTPARSRHLLKSRCSTPAVVASMQETLTRLIATAQWIESTATTLQKRLCSVEQWFMEHGPDVRLNGRPSGGYVDYVAQARKG